MEGQGAEACMAEANRWGKKPPLCGKAGAFCVGAVIFGGRAAGVPRTRERPGGLARLTAGCLTAAQRRIRGGLLVRALWAGALRR